MITKRIKKRIIKTNEISFDNNYNIILSLCRRDITHKCIIFVESGSCSSCYQNIIITFITRADCQLLSEIRSNFTSVPRIR